jgi:DNA-binding NarL/FixJ family response regulator
VAAGATDDVIARQLGISPRTLRRRLHDLFDELGASNRFHAGVEAARRGWV